MLIVQNEEWKDTRRHAHRTQDEMRVEGRAVRINQVTEDVTASGRKCGMSPIKMQILILNYGLECRFEWRKYLKDTFVVGRVAWNICSIALIICYIINTHRLCS